MLFSSTAGAGHFGPMIPIAHACAAAGHAVAVAAPASFGGSVAKAGLAHLPLPDVPSDQVGAVYNRLPSLPREEANRVVVAEVFGRLDAQTSLTTLLTVIREWRPDVVIRDPAEFGALVAAERFGLPQVRSPLTWAASSRRWRTG
jgi:UDP:flavonoid glycosyltransferase YjiC (YdhE family)